jgi:predicted dehydrogenase
MAAMWENWGMPLSRRSLLSGTVAAAAAAPLPAVRLPHKVRVGLFGLDGHIGEILDPLPSLPDVELVAIGDPDPQALARLAKRPVAAHARRYTDPHRMFAGESLDVVALCGDNGSRSGLILAAAARKFHVAAEKPLALEREDLEKVRRAIAAEGVALTMLLPIRFLPVFVAMREIVRAGRIGEVAQIGAQKSYKLGERPDWMRHRSTFGGTIPYIGIHMVDLMRFVSGRELVEAASFQARIGHPDMEDMENTTSTIFRLDNGGTAALRLDYLRPETAPTHGDDRLRLAGSKGILEYRDDTGLTLMTSQEKPHVIREFPQPRPLFVDFLSSVYLHTPAALDLRDIYRVNEIVLAVRDAAVRHEMVRL